MYKLSDKDKILHEQFSNYGKNAKEWMQKCVLLLPNIEKNRIWKKKGFSSIYEYAAKVAGMSKNKVDDSLRIIHKIEDKPNLMQVAKVKGLNSVRPVATIATKESEEFWAKKAMEMSMNTLVTYVRDYRSESGSATGLPPNYLNETGRNGQKSLDGGDNQQQIMLKKIERKKIQVSMKLDPEIVESLKKIKGDGDWNDAMIKLLKLSKKELQKEQNELTLREARFQEELKAEKPEAVKSKHRSVPKKIKKYVIKRARSKCEHPNCHKPGKHIHHLEFFSFKKEHDPDKLFYLCEEHHHLIHLGYIDDSKILESIKRSSMGTGRSSPWAQVEKLPSYDIKNLVNGRIAEFKRSYRSNISCNHNNC